MEKRQRLIRRTICLVAFLPPAAWGALSLWHAGWPAWTCIALASVYSTTHFGIVLAAPIRYMLPLLILVFMLPLLAFLLATPSHDRNWQPDVARMPRADMNGNKVVVHHVRNNDYTSETSFETRYETRTYDLTRLRSLDVLLTDWGLEHVVHAMFSFGFEGDDYLCLSIEARKEVGEGYSSLKGFFRAYELIYVLGDERDMVRLRTNFRKGEDVYLYRIRMSSAENLSGMFLEFMNRINQLHDRPEWYNALYENCMTSAFRVARKYATQGRDRWHWSVLLNGYAPRHAYENGTIDASMPFEKMKKASWINDRARAAGSSDLFSILIREGIPGMAYRP